MSVSSAIKIQSHKLDGRAEEFVTKLDAGGGGGGGGGESEIPSDETLSNGITFHIPGAEDGVGSMPSSLVGGDSQFRTGNSNKNTTNQTPDEREAEEEGEEDGGSSV